MGRISRVEVREGDRVSRGQLMARLEDRDLQAAAEQARAGIAIAEAQLANSRAQYDRMVQLRERGSVTPKNLEDATSGFRVAEAALQKSQADLAAAEAALDYAQVRSPIDGWVVSQRVEAGDMAAPGSPFFTIENLDPVKVTVQVPEADVVGLEEGIPASVRIPALDREVEAEIDRVVPSGDPVSRTFAVQLLVDNPNGDIKSGMYARVLISSGEREVLTVPESALVHRGQMEGIFVVEGGTARLRWIKSGRGGDGRVEVISGLDAGERYVLDPPARLRDGSPVSEG
jgi:RND family efflux transporter MFP subunit